MEESLKQMKKLVEERAMLTRPYDFSRKPTMMDFENLTNIVKREKKSKWESPYDLQAMYCENEEDFELLRCYIKAANTSPCDSRDVMVDGKFKDPDWYFPEEATIDYDMGAHVKNYWMESLTHKKNRYKNFIASFEEE